MKKTNIMFLITSLEIGGTEKIVVSLAKNLDKSRYNIFVCSICPLSALADELRGINGVHLFTLNIKIKKLFITAIPKLFVMLKQYKINILQSFLFIDNILGSVVGRLAGTPIVILGQRGTIMSVNEDMEKHNIRFYIQCAVSRFSDLIVANSNYYKTYLCKHNIHHSKIQIIYNGVNIHKSDSPIGAETGIKKNNSIILGIVSRLIPQKGHKYLFKALALLGKDYLNKIVLLIIGDGVYRSYLEKLSEGLSISEKVVFLGERNDVDSLLDVIDIVILTSVYGEGTPNAILEAMAKGKPVIATRVGGIPEIVIDGETGILVEPRNPTALANAILLLLRDGNLRRNMGTAAKERISNNFTLTKMINNYEAIYTSLLKKKYGQL